MKHEGSCVMHLKMAVIMTLCRKVDSSVHGRFRTKKESFLSISEKKRKFETFEQCSMAVVVSNR